MCPFDYLILHSLCYLFATYLPPINLSATYLTPISPRDATLQPPPLLGRPGCPRSHGAPAPAVALPYSLLSSLLLSFSFFHLFSLRSLSSLSLCCLFARRVIIGRQGDIFSPCFIARCVELIDVSSCFFFVSLAGGKESQEES